jgi:hypothetical protein
MPAIFKIMLSEIIAAMGRSNNRGHGPLQRIVEEES